MFPRRSKAPSDLGPIDRIPRIRRKHRRARLEQDLSSSEFEEAPSDTSVEPRMTASQILKRTFESFDFEDPSKHPLLTTHENQDEAKKPSAKRQKKSIEDDLICSISLDLPFDPVFAEDGAVSIS